MFQPTNSLVANLKKFALPAGSAAAVLVVGAGLLLNHVSVHAASAAAAAPLDDNSVSSLVSLDNAVEAVAARVNDQIDRGAGCIGVERANDRDGG